MISVVRRRERRATGLRRMLFLLLGGVLLYIMVLVFYVGLRVAPAAARVSRESEPMLRLFTQLTERARTLRTAELQVQQFATRDEPADSVTLERIRKVIASHEGRITPEPLARIPSSMRIPLARADDEASRLQGALLELVAAVELGRRRDLGRRLFVVDSLEQNVARHLAAAQRAGLDDLRERELELDTVTAEVVRAMIWWLIFGALLAPVIALIVWQRVGRPLLDLEAGLTRVAEGDLSAELPVRRPDEIGRLIAHFNEMTRVLRLRAEEQGRFSAAGQLIAGVAHEVNNPLMAIAALTDTRLEDPDLTEAGRGDWLQVKRQARRAGKLLSGLLRFVRSGQPRVHSVSLNAVARDAIDLVAYRFAVDEITLETRLDAGDPHVLVDAGRLEQVLVNLLSNAIDAMLDVPPPRRLRLESWRDGEQVLVAVTDTGAGVPPEMASRLFHPFVTTKGASGTGLGLYISRQIMREAGGDLMLERRVEPGARFVGRLPAAPTALQVKAAPVVPRRSSGGRSLAGIRVLVTDDEAAVRRPIAQFLARRGAEVRQAVNGREALDLLALHEVDVILADLRMPVMDGAELYAHLAVAHPALAQRLIFLSGDLSQLSATDLVVPADRVLVKPVDLADIEEKVLEVSPAPAGA